LPVAIVVNAHHESAAKADESHRGLEGAAVGPEVHDADLGLGGTVGGLDNRLEGDALLQKIVMAVRGRDSVEIFVCGGELNSLACERVEGLEEKAFALMRQGFDVTASKPVVEEDGFGDGGMIEVGERKFADAEVPVGVASPFDVEVVSVVERELDGFSLEFVDDGSIVDTMNGDFASFALIEEAIALLAEFGDVDGGDVEPVLVDAEVGESLLVVRIDLEEDDVFGVVVADDDLAEELPVALLGETAEVRLQ
jgi:hypothetical protein